MREMSCYNCVRANQINECEACVFRDKYDFEDEWLIGEIED